MLSLRQDCAVSTNYLSKFHILVPAAFMMTNAVATHAQAVSSAELYTAKSYLFGRIEARIQFAAGDGVVSSFFLWKDGSEKAGTFWNELDFEKLGADCHLETNALFGNPSASHTQKPSLAADLCGGFHTYTYEWTPDYIAWFVDGVEIRREVGTVAAAYKENATAGMQIRFNIWPGDASFGGVFSPAILPVHEYINWIEYSSYTDGAFKLEWREDFDAATLPSGWLTGSWGSPKNLSTHNAGNVTFVNGFAVLSLTADNALGSTGVAPSDDGTTPVVAPTGGATGAGGSSSAAGHSSVGGSSATTQSSTSSDDGGCNVVRPRSRGIPSLLGMLVALGAVLGRRRRTA